MANTQAAPGPSGGGGGGAPGQPQDVQKYLQALYNQRTGQQKPQPQTPTVQPNYGGAMQAPTLQNQLQQAQPRGAGMPGMSLVPGSNGVYEPTNVANNPDVIMAAKPISSTPPVPNAVMTPSGEWGVPLGNGVYVSPGGPGQDPAGTIIGGGQGFSGQAFNQDMAQRAQYMGQTGTGQSSWYGQVEDALTGQPSYYNQGGSGVNNGGAMQQGPNQGLPTAQSLPGQQAQQTTGMDQQLTTYMQSIGMDPSQLMQGLPIQGSTGYTNYPAQHATNTFSQGTQQQQSLQSQLGSIYNPGMQSAPLASGAGPSSSPAPGLPQDVPGFLQALYDQKNGIDPITTSQQLAQASSAPPPLIDTGKYNEPSSPGEADFMLAIQSQEDASGNPQEMNTSGSGAWGLYQMLKSNWYGSPGHPGWAQQAGVDPNDTSPQAQNAVAQFKMNQYYQQYGNWADVAAAWYGGGLGEQAYAAGQGGAPQSTNGQSYPSINSYVASIMGKDEGLSSMDQNQLAALVGQQGLATAVNSPAVVGAESQLGANAQSQNYNNAANYYLQQNLNNQLANANYNIQTQNMNRNVQAQEIQGNINQAEAQQQYEMQGYENTLGNTQTQQGVEVGQYGLQQGGYQQQLAQAATNLQQSLYGIQSQDTAAGSLMSQGDKYQKAQALLGYNYGVEGINQGILGSALGQQGEVSNYNYNIGQQQLGQQSEYSSYLNSLANQIYGQQIFNNDYRNQIAALNQAQQSYDYQSNLANLNTGYGNSQLADQSALLSAQLAQAAANPYAAMAGMYGTAGLGS